MLPHHVPSHQKIRFSSLGGSRSHGKLIGLFLVFLQLSNRNLLSLHFPAQALLSLCGLLTLLKVSCHHNHVTFDCIVFPGRRGRELPGTWVVGG